MSAWGRVIAGLVAAAACLFALPTSASAGTETFSYTGGPQTWTVPLGVHSATFDLYGGAGTNNGNSGQNEGLGGHATATFDVTPGQSMQLYVGGAGAFAQGGFNGGGKGFAGGGGGTDLRIGGNGLGNRVLIAGGGGGVGNYGGAATGGYGGGLVGTSGASPTAGAPGTQTEGGAGTWPGSLGQGGGGGFGSGMAFGGGGGGYYGGGTNDQEGGGGSGFGPAGTVFETGVRSGNGEAIITYTQITYALDVDVLGGGEGHVDSSPVGIDCGFDARLDCSADFPENAQVTLTATAEPGSIFTGWSGACTGSSTTCSVDMSQARSVDATFAETRTLSVTKSGTGIGSVTTNPAGIDCDSACSDDSADFELDSSVTLTAAPATGSEFSFWTGGGCSGVSTTCTVTMSQARSVQATFTADQVSLAVGKQGNGGGTVTSDVGGINCGATCNHDYNYGTEVVLTASPAGDSDFAGWSGDGCSGTATTCTVTMDQARTVQATLTLQKRALTVTKTGTGSGGVSSAPAGIDCGSICAADFNINSSVTLIADAAHGSDFSGWTGACTGSSVACTVTMDQARSAEATFTLEQRTLSVSRSGNGAGAVTAAPAGIDCGESCSSDYDFGSSVTLTATAAANSSFGGWGGACEGAETTCTVTMDQARSATATFTLRKRSLTVTKFGAGAGKVSSGLAGIDCGASCSAGFDDGTSVTLTAMPAAGSSFSGWGGACSGTSPTCTVSMTQARSVTAGFGLVPPETTIIKKPKKQSTKRKAKFKFSSDQQGSTFECAIDGGPFEPCTSPARLKLKPGWHTFRVRAIARTGAADPTPAKAKFRIKRKKR